MLEATATNRYVRTSAQKAKLVLDLIRGKKAADALSILRFTKKSIARDIEKTLRSAIANAVLVADRNQKRRLDEEDLVVSACFAGQGPSQKRVRPAPMGRAFRIIRRTAHITVRVAEEDFGQLLSVDRPVGGEDGPAEPGRDGVPGRQARRHQSPGGRIGGIDDGAPRAENARDDGFSGCDPPRQGGDEHKPPATARRSSRPGGI